MVYYHLHRATLQHYNYALLSLIIAQPLPIDSLCSYLFSGVQVIRIYSTICGRQSVQLSQNVLMAKVKPSKLQLLCTASVAVFLIASSMVSIHTFAYCGQAYNVISLTGLKIQLPICLLLSFLHNRIPYKNMHGRLTILYHLIYNFIYYSKPNKSKSHIIICLHSPEPSFSLNNFCCIHLIPKIIYHCEALQILESLRWLRTILMWLLQQQLTMQLLASC